MNMSRLRIFSALVYFHFQCQEIPQVQDGRLAVVEEVHPLLHLGAGHTPCIDDRVCMGCFIRRFLEPGLSAITLWSWKVWFPSQARVTSWN